MRSLLLFLGINFLTLTLAAQKDSIRYTADFQFERGIYPEFEDWKNQDPVKPSEVIVDIDANSARFFQYLFAREEFRYPREHEIVYKKPDDIFGYAPGGEEMYYGTDYKFEVIGAICLLREVGQVDSYSSFVNPGEEFEAAREEGSGKLYMLDFHSGDFSKLKKRKVKSILKQDAELYQRFRKAKGKGDEKLRAFIKEYNYRHPIYFPNAD
ncbi:MAG: hypothetical protein GVY26_02530 [Bacteroidetes bacterium]|jgi:hypothetical protein|nr:hypothetical protein [Bacteroidota bacterium]